MHAPPADALTQVLQAMELKGVTRDDLVAQGVASRNCLTQVFCRRKPLDPALLTNLIKALEMSGWKTHVP